jgi:hypothetical protein
MEIFKYIIAALGFVGVLWWDIISDYKKWKKKIPINHTGQLILRSFLLIPCILLLVIPYVSVWQILAALGMAGSIWWEFFDGFYNKIRGFSWRFNGTVDPDDSFLDRFLYKFSPLQETILKWGLIVIFTTLYILL